MSARVHPTRRRCPLPTTGTDIVSATLPNRRVATDIGTVTAAPSRRGRPMARRPRTVAIVAACL